MFGTVKFSSGIADASSAIQEFAETENDIED
jgi:hypothetical protein